MWSPRRWGASGASVTTAWWFDNVHEENNDQVSSLGYRIFGQTHIVIPDYNISIHFLEWAERIHRRFPWKTSARRFESLILGIAHGLTKVDHRMKVHFFYFYSCVRSSFCDCLARYKNIVFNPLFDAHPNLIIVFWLDWKLKSPISQFWLLINFNVPWVRQTSAGVPMVFAPWWYDCVSAVSFVFSCILRVGISWHDIPTIEWTSIYMINYIHITWLCICIHICTLLKLIALWRLWC